MANAFVYGQGGNSSSRDQWQELARFNVPTTLNESVEFSLPKTLYNYTEIYMVCNWTLRGLPTTTGGRVASVDICFSGNDYEFGFTRTQMDQAEEDYTDDDLFIPRILYFDGSGITVVRGSGSFGRDWVNTDLLPDTNTGTATLATLNLCVASSIEVTIYGLS